MHLIRRPCASSRGVNAVPMRFSWAFLSWSVRFSQHRLEKHPATHHIQKYHNLITTSRTARHHPLSTVFARCTRSRFPRPLYDTTPVPHVLKYILERERRERAQKAGVTVDPSFLRRDIVRATSRSSKWYVLPVWGRGGGGPLRAVVNSHPRFDPIRSEHDLGM